MATGTNIKTYFEGAWHNEDKPIMRAADHGSWLGTTVFDGARYFDGVTPDLLTHCERINRSAKALMIAPTIDPNDMVSAIQDGLKSYDPTAAVYIRPMYWATIGDDTGILPSQDETGFANLVVWSKVFEKYRKVILRSRLLMVSGKLQIEGEVIHVVVNSCFNLNNLMRLDVVGRNIGSAQKAISSEKESGEKENLSGNRIVQGELFRSRDFK